MRKVLLILFLLLATGIVILVSLAIKGIFFVPNSPILSGEDCDQMQDTNLQWLCYGIEANKTGDPSICEKIIDRQNRHLCYSNIARNWKRPTLCNKAVSVRVRCINDYAEFNKDISICNMHNEETLVKECKELLK